MMAERSWTWAIFMWCNITSEEEEPYCHLKRMDASLISCIGLWTCTAVSCFLSEGKTSEPSKLLVVSPRCSITSIDFSKGETFLHQFEVNSSLICGQELYGPKYWFSWFLFRVAYVVQRCHSEVCIETVCVRLWWGNWKWGFASCTLDLGGFKYCSPASTFIAL